MSVCVVVWSVYSVACVWCATLNPPLSPLPCADSERLRVYIQKRLRLYRQHVHMLKKTCGRVASTRGDVLDAYTEA